MQRPDDTPEPRSPDAQTPHFDDRDPRISRRLSESTRAHGKQNGFVGEREIGEGGVSEGGKVNEHGEPSEGITWNDESMELSTELTAFAARLTTCSPAPASLDPAITFYRAGYAAALAERAKPSKSDIPLQPDIPSQPGIPLQSDIPTLQLVASWMLIVALAGPAGYLWGHRQGTATQASAQRELEIEAASRPPVAPAGHPPEETTEPRRLTSPDDDATNSDGMNPTETRPDAAVPYAPGAPQVPFPSVAPALAGNAPTAPNDMVWSHIRRWLPWKESMPASERSLSWTGYYVNPKVRAEWVERLTAQIHDPAADTFRTRHDLSTGGMPARPDHSATNGSTRPVDRLTPISYRSVLEKRSQLMDALLQ